MFFYLETKYGAIKYTYHNLPQQEGLFLILTELLSKYSCLLDFSSTEPIYALLIQEFQNDTLINFKIVNCVAVECKIENMNRCNFST